MSTEKGLIVSANNPFKEDVLRFIRTMKDHKRTHEVNGYRDTKIVITEQTRIFPGSFAKLYQNRTMLSDLSPEACKVLLHIATHMNFEQELINVKATDIMMEKRRTFKGLNELVFKRIISKQKKEWYWVNITLLIVGNIDKQHV